MSVGAAMLRTTHDYIIPIAINLISDIIASFAGWAYNRSKKRPGQGLNRWAGAAMALGTFLLLVVAECAIGLGFAASSRRPAWWLIAVLALLPPLIYAYIVLRELLGFWRVGLTYVDRTIRAGTGYSAALACVSSSLKFMGTGASKLTSTENFTEVIQKCSAANGEIRFLLRRPDSPGLRDAARRAGKGESDYRSSVVSSLRKLADLRTNGASSIEVRFYDDVRPLRLMIIDGTSALLSYNVYGSPKAADLFPQLHLRTQKVRTDGFFWAIEQYYDNEWDRASSWDFREFLE